MTGSDYEWAQHWRVAKTVFGCDGAELIALREQPLALAPSRELP
jgi:hypothetical protein